MSTVFRQATLEDDAAFLALALAAFEPIRRLGINFSAAHADIDMVRRHISSHGVYVMERDGHLVSSFSIRYPWGRSQALTVCRIWAGSPPIRTINSRGWAGR